MDSQDFIGFPGSREDAINQIDLFLRDKTTSGYFKVVGTWQVGKTEVIKAAKREVNSCALWESNGYIELGIEEVKDLVLGIPRRPRKNNLPGAVLYDLNEKIEEEARRQGGVAVFRLSISGLRDDHSLLDRLFKPEPCKPMAKSWSPRKVVLESHEEIDPKWQNLSRGMVKVFKFLDDEAERFLARHLGALLHIEDSARSSAVRRIFCLNVGYHPALLRRLCEVVHSYGQKYLDDRLKGNQEDFERAIDKLIQDDFDGVSRGEWKKFVEKVIGSLSEDARSTIRQACRDYHPDVDNAGLIVGVDDRRDLARVVRKFIPIESCGRRVFVSYSEEDSAFVGRLRADLESSGASVWIYEENRAGQDIPKSVFSEIGRADVFILVWSRHSPASNWQNRELDVAMMRELSRKDVSIIPALKDHQVELPSQVSSLVYADFRDEYEKGKSQLVQAIEETKGTR